MSDCCTDKACEIEALRHEQATVLGRVLVINAAMFGVELLTGLVAGSVSLVSDSMDMLGDSLVYAFSLYAVAESRRMKALSALFKGVVMAVFALVAFGQVLYKLIVPHVPPFEAIGGIGLLALAANAVCFALLWHRRSDDINMSSVWLCSRNDLIANSAVILAAVGVWLTRAAWPDLVVGAAIAVLFARSAFSVLVESARELGQARA
jgi:Co/Zn/Cd efflux system component